MRLLALLATFAIIPAAGAEPAARAPTATPPPAVRASAKLEPEPRPPSLTLHRGAVSGAVSFELGVAKGRALAPTSIAPDLFVGITDRFTLGAVTSSSGLTGFRGSAGSGYCVTTPEEGCPRAYTTGGVDGLFAVLRGSVQLAVNAGMIWSAYKPTVHNDLKLGFKLKLTEGRVFAMMTPNVWLALDDRHDRALPHEHQLFVPISFWVKPAAKLALGVASGVKGPLEGFKDRMSIPAGGLVQLAVDPHVSVGGSFVFGKVIGGSEVMNLGTDARAVQIWINLTSG